MRILVVDDNEVNRKLLRVILSAHGHEIVESANGLEALESSTFDAPISDVLMPGVDGYRLCSEVRRSERSRDLPIIVYSSIYASPADEQVALTAGADRFIPRPASREALLETLNEVCGASRGPEPATPPAEPEVLKTYNEQLVTKLKERSQELETVRVRLVEGNEDLRRANDALALAHLPLTRRPVRRPTRRHVFLKGPAIRAESPPFRLDSGGPIWHACCKSLEESTQRGLS